MKCPKCGNMDTKVLDSRVVDEGKSIRRRRECEYCQTRFTTFEKISVTDLAVVKKDGTKEIYDRMKIKKALLLAFAKRKVSIKTIDDMISSFESKWSGMGKEISSKQIGEDILDALKEIDVVAYVRFASVYKNFESFEDFHSIVNGEE